MEEVTKNVDSLVLNIDDPIVEKIIMGEIENKIASCEQELEKIKKTCQDALIRINKDGWIKVKNKNLYCCTKSEKNILIPDIRRKSIEFDSNSDIYAWDDNGNEIINIDLFTTFEGIKMHLMSKEEAQSIFNASDKHNPLVGTATRYISYANKECRVVMNGANSYRSVLAMVSGVKYIWYDLYSNSFNDYAQSEGLIIPVFTSEKTETILSLFVSKGLIPYGINENEEKAFKTIISLFEQKSIETGNSIQFTSSYKDEIYQKRVKNVLGISFSEQDILKSMETKKLSEGDVNAIVKKYLECDKDRADIEPYDEGQIFEVNRGHWELWSLQKEASKDRHEIKINLGRTLVARKPVFDINKKGVVGIDFGTKSTVVVLLDDNSRIHQMRIGNGNLKKEVKKSDYENPTVMELRDIVDFMTRYQSRKGRPNTLWNNITVSHTAVDSLQNAQNSQDFYSFFSDLKQWSDDSTRKIRIKDLKCHEEILKDFLEIDEKSLNPIEVYAYYLGLAINNMRNGIYLDYILSYPVNYPVKVRNKIVESFERGLKKSLPEEVLNDKESMSLFRVQAGVSEPAAYAVSALKGYGFYPEEGEKHFYGIFDFGGGTTDFDFGIFRGAEGKECRRSDYVIEHFGAGGDRYLGGENLLELLAFDVFKANRKTMLEKDLTFFKPNERSEFSGSEMLISNSQEARLNMRQLMEKLRCFWESGIGIEKGMNAKETSSDSKDGDIVKTNVTAGSQQVDESIRAIKEGTIKVSLFDKKGNVLPNVELHVDEKQLLETLTERIRVGVNNFFEAIKNTFDRPEVEDIKKINIFLAGNSCKTPIVSQLFNDMIDEKTREIGAFYKEKRQAISVENLFEIFPALGTREAEIKQKELGIIEKTDLAEYEKPTGKTGVAYGLLDGRSASRIKIVSEIESTDETKFKFYIGYEKRGKFHVEIDRDVDYKKWIEFIDAFETDFELLYTSLPEATTNQMDITRVKRMPCRISKSYEDVSINVFLRVLEPDTMEYVVGKYDDVNNNKYMEGPYKIKLEE